MGKLTAFRKAIARARSGDCPVTGVTLPDGYAWCNMHRETSCVKCWYDWLRLHEETEQ